LRADPPPRAAFCLSGPSGARLKPHWTALSGSELLWRAGVHRWRVGRRRSDSCPLPTLPERRFAPCALRPPRAPI